MSEKATVTAIMTFHSDLLQIRIHQPGCQMNHKNSPYQVHSKPRQDGLIDSATIPKVIEDDSKMGWISVKEE